MWKKISISLCLLLFLQGSPLSADAFSHDKEPSEPNFIGQTVDTLMLSKGSPSSVVVLSTGDSVWTYQLLKTDGFDCSDPTKASNTENTKLSWIETETYLIGSNHIIKSYSTSVE